MTFAIGLCLQVLLIIIQYKESNASVLCIGQDRDYQNKLCQSQTCNTSSLPTLPLHLQGNVRPYFVIFCTTEVSLETNVQFQDLYNVTFIGDHNKTVISCANQAGLTFTNSEEVHLENLIFDHCGALHNSTSINITTINSSFHFYSSIFLFHLTNFSMNHVAIKNSNGLGIVLFDVAGVVSINQCLFDNNRVEYPKSESYGGGGGMYVEFTYCPLDVYNENCSWYNSTSRHSVYNISYSNFTNNNASRIRNSKVDSRINSYARFRGFGRGGGLQVIFKGDSFGSSVTVYNCTFINNTAVWGGGLEASFQDESMNNSLIVVKCTFQQNTCPMNGGGGANIGYTFYKPPFPCHNRVAISDSIFNSNDARFGGGLAFYSSDSDSGELNNAIELNRCTWEANRAHFGSAIALSIHSWTTYLSGNLPTPTFTDAKFIENTIIDKHSSDENDVYTVYKNGTGAFFATRYTLEFHQSLEFTKNNGSAMYLTSCVMKIAPYTIVNFTSNSGFNGGAIALIAFSVIVLEDNSMLLFQNNVAVGCGGAIYSYSIDKHDYISSRSCFLQNSHPISSGDSYDNVSIRFIGNYVGQATADKLEPCGHSINAVTLMPCLYYCKQNVKDILEVEEVFTCVGNITFDNEIKPRRRYEVTTSGARFIYDSNMTNFSAIPGMETFLPVNMVDDLNQTVKAQYHLSIVNKESSQIKADKAYTYLSENRTELYGKPQDSANLLLSKIGLRGIAISFSIYMETCPPGYILFDDSQFDLNLSRCKCSAGTNQSYGGIHHCDDDKFKASIQHGWWIGYVGNETENDLLFGYCPDRFCFREEEYNRTHWLTVHASREKLDMRVCNDTRTGVLCGKCREGYSALYHSSSSECSKDCNCKFGWLLYIASELLPLTLMFTIIIAFNISFVSGDLNGFIFFVQIFDLLSITGNGFIWFPTPAFKALKSIKFIYGFLNFDFFKITDLSFCLWKGATTLDMIIFKFVTVIYALFLIVLTIWLMNKCDVYKRLSCLRVSTVKTSVTHGLSAFLVMVYTQCAKVSFKLIDFTVVYSKGSVPENTVVTYQGDLEHFKGKHLLYAIPAIFTLIVVILTPVIILTLYPAIFKVISCLKLEEARCISWIVLKVPHAYLKPFADSFQSTFKDNVRFFAGFYFAYRIIILIGWFAPSRLTQSYSLLELILIAILAIHAIAQPYNNRKHNILDALLFFNLAIINGITVYNYHYARFGVEAFIYIQLVLAYIPLICFLIYATLCFIRKVKSYRNSNTALNLQLKELMNVGSDDELPSRLNENEDETLESSGDIDYELFKEQTELY